MVADLPPVATGRPADDEYLAAALIDLAAKADILNGSVIGLRTAVQGLERRMTTSEGLAAIAELRADIAETRADTSETRADLAEEEHGTFTDALRKLVWPLTRKPPR